MSVPAFTVHRLPDGRWEIVGLDDDPGDYPGDGVIINVPGESLTPQRARVAHHVSRIGGRRSLW
jgi:hypothetical protein